MSTSPVKRMNAFKIKLRSSSSRTKSENWPKIMNSRRESSRRTATGSTTSSLWCNLSTNSNKRITTCRDTCKNRWQREPETPAMQAHRLAKSWTIRKTCLSKEWVSEELMLTTSSEELVDKHKPEEIVQDLFKLLKSIRLMSQGLRTCISNQLLMRQPFSQDSLDPPQSLRTLNE